MQMNKAKITATALIIALMLVGLIGIQATSAGTKGFITIKDNKNNNIDIKSVCGDPSRGLLYAVGNSSNTGLIYKINNLDSSKTGYAQSVYSTTTLKYVTCKVGPDDTLWVVGVPSSSSSDLVMAVFRINFDGTLRAIGEESIPFSATEEPIDLDIIRSSTTGLPEFEKYIIMLATNNPVKNYAFLYNITVVIDTSSVGNPTISSFASTKNTIISGTDSGNEVYDTAVTKISIGEETFYFEGVLVRFGSTLKLQLYEFDDNGNIKTSSSISLPSDTGSSLKSAIANYTDGFLVAAGGSLYYYRYDARGGWVLDYSIENSYSGDADRIIVAVGSNSEAAYILSESYNGLQYNILVSAIDLVAKSKAYNDTVIQGQALRYGDPIVAWVDSDGNIVGEDATGASPYYIDAAASSSSSYSPAPTALSSDHGVAYYDLTQDGLVPYPVPEPWYVGLAVLAIALVAVMYYGRGNR